MSYIFKQNIDVIKSKIYKIILFFFLFNIGFLLLYRLDIIGLSAFQMFTDRIQSIYENLLGIGYHTFEDKLALSFFIYNMLMYLVIGILLVFKSLDMSLCNLFLREKYSHWMFKQCVSTFVIFFLLKLINYGLSSLILGYMPKNIIFLFSLDFLFTYFIFITTLFIFIFFHNNLSLFLYFGLVLVLFSKYPIHLIWNASVLNVAFFLLLDLFLIFCTSFGFQQNYASCIEESL